LLPPIDMFLPTPLMSPTVFSHTTQLMELPGDFEPSTRLSFLYYRLQLGNGSV